MKAQHKSVIDIIRGKNKVGGATKKDVGILLSHIDALEALLDQDDCEDIHGTEGWRHYLDIEE